MPENKERSKKTTGLIYWASSVRVVTNSQVGGRWIILQLCDFKNYDF